MKENRFTLKKLSREYSAEKITDADYVNDLVPRLQIQLVKSNLLEQAANGTGLYINSNKIELACFNKGGEISLNGKPLKLERPVYVFW